MDPLWETSQDWFAGSYGGRWTDLEGEDEGEGLESGTYSGFGVGGLLSKKKKKKKPSALEKLYGKGKHLLGRGAQMFLPGGEAEGAIPGVPTSGSLMVPLLIGGGLLLFLLMRRR